MRVAIDVGPLGPQPTGVGRYTQGLLDGLRSRRVDLRPYVVSLRASPDPKVARWRVPARIAELSWRLLERPSIESLVGEVNVVHGTNFVLPATRSAAGVVTVHDLSFLRDDAGGQSARLRKVVPWSVERAAAVLVPTRAVADEVCSSYRVSPGAVFVTPEGVAHRFFGAPEIGETPLRSLGISKPFCLALGGLEPRKNIPRLVRAWEAAGLSRKGWSLALVGARRAIAEPPMGAGVVTTGYVDDDLLPGLLSAATMFCYPSLYEGFGLPPIEAMAAGTPVVAARQPSTQEVLGDAALLVDGRDVEALAGALTAVAKDEALRDRLRSDGVTRARSFSWERTTEATLAAYAAAA